MQAVSVCVNGALSECVCCVCAMLCVWCNGMYEEACMLEAALLGVPYNGCIPDFGNRCCAACVLYRAVCGLGGSTRRLACWRRHC